MAVELARSHPADLPDLDTERGEPWGLDRVFGDFEDGKVFDLPDFESLDMAVMLGQDGNARQLEQALTLPVRAAGWDIVAGKGDHGEADRVREDLTRPADAGGMSTPLDLVVGQATAAFAYKRAFFEKVFTRSSDTGRIVYDKLAWRPPATCQIARDAHHGGFRGFRQQPVGPEPTVTWVDIPATYAWVYVHGQAREPLSGMSDLQVTYWCWKTKQKIRYLWYVYLEAQALPKTLVSHKNEKLAARIARKVATLKSRAVLALPAEVKVDAYESSGKGAGQFVEALRFLDQEMLASGLAGFANLTAAAANGHGSYGLSKDATGFFLQARQAAARELAADITHRIIAPLVRYNRGPDAVVPAFRFGPLAQADVAQTVSLLEAIALAPAVHLPQEFLDELASKTATYLNLDLGKVEQAIKAGGHIGTFRTAQAGGSPQLGTVKGAVDTATGMVRRAHAGRDPLPTALTADRPTSIDLAGDWWKHEPRWPAGTPGSIGGRWRPVRHNLGDSVQPIAGTPANIVAALDDARRTIARVHDVDRAMPTIRLTALRTPHAAAIYSVHKDPPHRALGIRVNMHANPAHMSESIIHELGHFLDHKGMGTGTVDFASRQDKTGIMADWWQATIDSTAVSEMLDMAAHILGKPGVPWSRIRLADGTVEEWTPGVLQLDYWTDKRELFARSYAQWIAQETGHKQMQAIVDRAVAKVQIARSVQLLSGRPPLIQEQWEPDDFEPIADALRDLFTRLGLYKGGGRP